MPDLALSKQTGDEFIDRMQAALNQCIGTAGIEIGNHIAAASDALSQQIDRLDGASIVLAGSPIKALNARIAELESKVRELESQK